VVDATPSIANGRPVVPFPNLENAEVLASLTQKVRALAASLWWSEQLRDRRDAAERGEASRDRHCWCPATAPMPTDYTIDPAAGTDRAPRLASPR